jgi:predicted TIM-barrel fold metal-dependent hydrolase
MYENQLICDTDLHHHYGSLSALEPYLPVGVAIPYYGGDAKPHPQGYYREDANPPRGGPPASDPEYVVEHHLDRYGIDYAILSCGSTLQIGGLPDEDLAAVIARATNDWTREEWFPVDDRFLGAIVVSLNDPDQAADEIRRCAADPRMVEVTANNAPCWLGNSFLDPVWAACQETGLPFNLHPGGANINTGTSIGLQQTFSQFRVSMCFGGVEHMMSLVWDGTFVKFPEFRFVLNEWGVSWLPFILWRMDMEYREAREEVPWLTDLPSAYVRRHVRLTTQPLDEPVQNAHLAQLLETVDGADLLMFSSDYPHHDFDDPEVVFRRIPEAWRAPVFFENARSWFRLDERLAGVAAGTRGAASA